MSENKGVLASYLEDQPIVALSIAMATEQAAQNIYAGGGWRETRYAKRRGALGLAIVAGHNHRFKSLNPFNLVNVGTMDYKSNASLDFYNGVRSDDAHTPTGLGVEEIDPAVKRSMPRYRMNAFGKAEAIRINQSFSSFSAEGADPNYPGVMRAAGGLLLGNFDTIWATSGLDQIDDHIASRAGSWAADLSMTEGVEGVVPFEELSELQFALEATMVGSSRDARNFARRNFGVRSMEHLLPQQVGEVVQFLDDGFLANAA